ncbi:MAG: LD-carboxypeptidase, partial [Phycisphaerales bacterium]
MSLPRIHLIAPAGACGQFLGTVQARSTEELIALVQETVGSGYAVTGDAGLMDAAEDELCGGRSDDLRRAEDIQGALADDNLAAMVLIRGGAWFTRIMPLIDFSVIDKRSKPVVVFGFSELTPLVNVVGSYAQGIGVYDMGPAFLTYGLRRFAVKRATDGLLEGMIAEDWVRSRLPQEFRAFFRDVVSIIEGRGSSRLVSAKLMEGTLPERCEATFVGGNLTVLSTMVGSRYSSYIA